MIYAGRHDCFTSTCIGEGGGACGGGDNGGGG